MSNQNELCFRVYRNGIIIFHVNAKVKIYNQMVCLATLRDRVHDSKLKTKRDCDILVAVSTSHVVNSRFELPSANNCSYSQPIQVDMLS